MNGNEFEQYLNKSVDVMVKNIIKTSLRNPRESIFMAGFAVSASRADKLRQSAARRGNISRPF